MFYSHCTACSAKPWSNLTSWGKAWINKSAHTALAVKACLLGCKTATLDAQVTFVIFVNIAVAISALGGPFKEFRTEPLYRWCFRVFSTIFWSWRSRRSWDRILGHFGASEDRILGHFGGSLVQFLLGATQRILHQAPISLVLLRFFDDFLGLGIKTVLRSNFGSFWSNFGSFWWLSGASPALAGLLGGTSQVEKEGLFCLTKVCFWWGLNVFSKIFGKWRRYWNPILGFFGGYSMKFFPLRGPQVGEKHKKTPIGRKPTGGKSGGKAYKYPLRGTRQVEKGGLLCFTELWFW